MPQPAPSLLAVLALAALPAPAPAAGQEPKPPVAAADDGLFDLETLAQKGFTDGSTEAAASAAGGGGTGLTTKVLPAGEGGTGTRLKEFLEYQLGDSYDPFGPPHPMVVAYHGYSFTASSVAKQSTLDEECNARGWIYLSVTGGYDQLFGSPLSQENTAAAIRWMQERFNVDSERVYMVGWSMGAGVVCNFAARHRDPDDVMIAALGTVGGSYDWTMTHFASASGVKGILEHPLNFAAPPSVDPFAYQRSSAVHFDPSSYPPYGGSVPDPGRSMAANLRTTPVWMTWDVGDVKPLPKAQNPLVAGFLQGLGGEVQTWPVSGTVDPQTGLPQTHSWLVLNEKRLFDFFDDYAVDRTPADFEARLDRDAAVSWTSVLQRRHGEFSYLEGTSDPALGAATIGAVDNAAEVAFDAARAELGGLATVRLTASSADEHGFDLRVRGFEAPPAYFLDAATGQLRPGTRSDPFAGALVNAVPGGGTADVTVVTDPTWSARLWTEPAAAAPGATLAVHLEGAAGASMAWLVVGLRERLTPLGAGLVMTVSPRSQAVVLPVALDGAGEAELAFDVPDVTGLAGLAGQRLLAQAVVLDDALLPAALSNMWVVDVD